MAGNYYVGRLDIGTCIGPGIKIWSNGIPTKADTYKSCSNRCTYCFARNQTLANMERNGIRYNPRIARTINLKFFASVLEKAHRVEEGWTYWALRNRYFIEFGTMCEVFQPEDKDMRVTWNFIQLCNAHKIPLFINSKGNLLVEDDNYFSQLASHSAPVIMNLTLTTIDDKLARRYEPMAPPPSERLKLIRRLTDAGIPTAVYLGPFMLGVSDVDIDGFVKASIEAGAVGLHLRNFYLTGKLAKLPVWSNYMKQYKEHFTRKKGYVNEWSSAIMKENYMKFREAAERYDPRFKIVGMKSHWFDLEPYHGKMALDWLPQPFKEGVIDFTAVPLMRKIRERLDQPQLLIWDKLGYKRDKINVPAVVPLGSGGVESEGAYLATGCFGSCNYRAFGNVWVDGFDWVKRALWNGMQEYPSGFMSTVKRVYPVLGADKSPVTANGDYLYAYIPAGQEAEYVTDGSVSEVTASGFYQPERLGGVEDKFMQVEHLYEYSGKHI